MGYLPQGMAAQDLPGRVGSPERNAFLWSLPATVELTHNHGSEAKEPDQVVVVVAVVLVVGVGVGVVRVGVHACWLPYNRVVLDCAL